jgi:hypothetical protein
VIISAWCALWVVTAHPAYAQAPLVVEVNREVGISASGLFQGYSETNVNPALNARTADSEQGWVPGFGVKASAMFNAFAIDNVFAAVRYNYNNGNTNYSGYSVNPPFKQISESSGEVVNDVGIEIGKGFLLLSDKAILIPALQAGYRTWDRVLPGGFSPEESYRFFAVGIGLRGDYAVTDRLAVMAKVGWEYTIDATDQTAANPGDSKPANLLDLGSRPIYQISLGADYRVTEHIHTFFQVDYTRFSFGQSQDAFYTVGRRLMYEYELPSLTNDVLLQFGVAWGF